MFHSNYKHRVQCSPKSMGKIVGVGFRPIEQELVDFYLKHKLLGDDSRVDVIPVINLCHVEPSDVPGILAKSRIRFGDPDWFFFSPVDFKYSNSKRVNRKTEKGFWKATGKDRDIRSWNTNTLIATKKNLVYYKGSVSCGVKSDWVIHEYHAVTFHESENAFVLCRLIKKPEKKTEGGTAALICDEGESSRSVVSDYENQAIAEGVPSGGTLTGMETICHVTYQAEKCISPTEPSLIEIEQDDDAYFRNENNNGRSPSEIMQIPYETMHTPCETMHTPYEIMQISCETMQTLYETLQIPCETMQSSCESMQTPCETMQTSFESMQTPCETMQTSFESMQTPCETMQTSFESMQTPCETMQTPFESLQTPCEPVQTLCESMQISCESMQNPCEPMQISCETMQISHETNQIPFEILQFLFETPFQTMQTPLETKQILPKLPNSLLADEYLVTQSKSLKRAYCESSYRDAEVVPERDASFEDISSLYTEYLNSEEYHVLKRFKTSYDVGHGDTHLLFSGQEASEEKQESIFQDDFWGLETSSCDSTTNKLVEINYSEISSFLCT
ncbi:NAC domain containing protein 52-like [Vigna unguiculata]|uniref:NAC domain containing protein 52-like n=1 Tax=Vigna unguiculata TaxID=3917 RepID=UPI001016D3FB|nr:NAC domain containing protein 52-like [Vigna unguiculata]XP_027908222.1 NAC domain containing protein 52-like [Vigna unguiculata]XP_027912578.1 NAC domain containing protein 52-like [Vigna unguiculata]